MLFRSIAKRTGQSVSDLAKMNKISDVNKISSGAKLMTKVPTPPSRPADTASAPKSTSAPSTTTTMKTSPASNQSDVARSVVRTKYGSPQSMATSVKSTRPAQASSSDITDKATYDTKTTSPAPFQSGPSSVKLSPEPQKFSGSAEGPTPVAKPTASASSSYKPVSPKTDFNKKYSTDSENKGNIGTVKTPTAADLNTDFSGKTTSEYGSIVRQDFNSVRPQSSPQSTPAPKAPEPEQKKKEAKKTNGKRGRPPKAKK